MVNVAEKIRLVENTADNAGTFDELDENGNRQGVTWVRDGYTEPRESLFDCAACDQPIKDWYLWTCMDDGDAAHLDCVEVVTP